MQVPPICARSISATFHPMSARSWDSGFPACPEPITIASYVAMNETYVLGHASGALFWTILDHDFRERDAPMRRSYSLDNHRVVLGPFEAMLARLTISGTVVPRLRGFDGRKFENDHSFDFGTLDHFVTAIGNAHVDRVTGQSGGRHFRVRFEFFRVAGVVAGKNHVSSHEILLSFQLSVAHLYHAIEKSTDILTDHRECGRHEDRVGNRLPRRGGSNSPSSSLNGSRISTQRGTLSGGQSPLEHRRIHFHRSHVLRRNRRRSRIHFYRSHLLGRSHRGSQIHRTAPMRRPAHWRPAVFLGQASDVTRFPAASCRVQFEVAAYGDYHVHQPCCRSCRRRNRGRRRR